MRYAMGTVTNINVNAADVDGDVIKLADRLHNMRTLGYCSKEKRVRKARETMDVYAPLADRFGMGAIKVVPTN